MEYILAELKAIAEETRLRIVFLLFRGELNVKDLTNILEQSQPRVSRHLKLLLDSNLINRYREGSWVYFKLSEKVYNHSFLSSLIKSVKETDPLLKKDLARLNTVKLVRNKKSINYFSLIAENWDNLHCLQLSGKKIEDAILEILDKNLGNFLDLGTGTGRMLELLSNRAIRSIGIDFSQKMLSYARLKFKKSGLINIQVRQGNIFNLPMESKYFDTVVIHQVLHYLDESLPVIKEASRVMKIKAKLLIVDFASHNNENLRIKHSHIRLGFSDNQMKEWGKISNMKLIKIQKFLLDENSSILNNISKKLIVSLWLFERI